MTPGGAAGFDDIQAALRSYLKVSSCTVHLWSDVRSPNRGRCSPISDFRSNLIKTKKNKRRSLLHARCGQPV